jgi:hypothetical protein
VPPAELEAVWEGARFDRMRAREASGELAKRYGRALTPGDPTDADSFKVRRGVIGGYRDELSAEDVTFCDDWLARLAYEPAVAQALTRSATPGARTP